MVTCDFGSRSLAGDWSGCLVPDGLAETQNRGFVGQIIVEIRDENTGDKSYPQYKNWHPSGADSICTSFYSWIRN